MREDCKYQVGDTVLDLRFGWGEVIDTKIPIKVRFGEDEGDDYPIKVRFGEDDDTENTYTKDGRFENDNVFPCLFTKEEARKLFPQYKRTKKVPAWIAVERIRTEPFKQQIICSNAFLEEGDAENAYPDRKVIEIEVEIDDEL